MKKMKSLPVLMVLFIEKVVNKNKESSILRLVGFLSFLWDQAIP